jgi:hypothetical protein
MYISNTNCCALWQLCGEDGSIKNKINHSLYRCYDINNQPTTIFCVTKDNEKQLMKNLKKEKFIPLFKFNRKKQYTNKKHTLIFWVKGLNKNTIKLIERK